MSTPLYKYIQNTAPGTIGPGSASNSTITGLNSNYTTTSTPPTGWSAVGAQSSDVSAIAFSYHNTAQATKATFSVSSATGSTNYFYIVSQNEPIASTSATIGNNNW